MISKEEVAETRERAESTLGLLAMEEPLVKVRMRLSALEAVPLSLLPIVPDLAGLSDCSACGATSSVSQGGRE